MAPVIKSRYYQRAALKAFLADLAARENPLCVLPTGSGKSLVIAAVIKQLSMPVLVLSHMRELLEQDAAALRSIAPDIQQGFYSAGLKEKRGHLPVVFGSVQSVYRSLPALGKRSLILIDEAHLAPRDADAMYAKVFKHFSLALRGGFTATNQRLDSGSLTSGPDAWFSKVSYEIGVKELIEKGYLLPLAGVLTEHQADLSGVRTRMGDFIASQAEAAVTKTLDVREVVKDIAYLAQRRRNWLLFAAGVAHAESIVDELARHQIDVALITGETPSEQRRETINRFKRGDLRALVNVGVLTTGFDAPQTDCIISLRPTKSPVLWQQIMGRGMRLAPGKENCLLLDFVGNLERLGGAGCVVKMQDRRQEISEARKEVTRSRTLDEPIDPKYQEVSLADPMKSGASFEARVEKVRYFIVPSKRFPGKSMLIASYSLIDDMQRTIEARAFVAVEFPGRAQYHAKRWFAARGVARDEVPHKAHAALALAQCSPEPAEVRVFWDKNLRCYLVMEERFRERVELSA